MAIRVCLYFQISPFSEKRPEALQSSGDFGLCPGTPVDARLAVPPEIPPFFSGGDTFGLLTRLRYWPGSPTSFNRSNSISCRSCPNRERRFSLACMQAFRFW